MTDDRSRNGTREGEDFLAEADTPSPGFLREFASLLRHNKKWWLTPIVVVILLFGAFLLLAATGAAPFVYTLF